jgi:uncharacterized protein YegJ (DUF2314 family)
MRLLSLYMLVLMFLLCSCPGRRKEPVRDRVMQIENVDEGLALIEEGARKTLPDFFGRLRQPRRGESRFMVKCPFPADQASGFGMEYLWLGDLRFKDGVYSGTVASRPFHIEGMEMGDTAVFDIDGAADWMYLKDGKIRGGLSIKYLIECIPEVDRDSGLDTLLKMFE